MRGDEQKDELIAAALRSYAEPPEIPDARIAVVRMMEGVRQQRQPRVRIWPRWVPVAICAAVMLIAGAVWLSRTPDAQQIAWIPQAPGPMTETFASYPPAPRGPHRRHSTPTHSVAEGKLLPKEEVFPTPEPLSPEERALMSFAVQAPAAEKKRVIEEREHLGDPIAIAAMEIRPLDEEEPARNRQ